MIVLEKVLFLREVTLFEELNDELLAQIAYYSEEEKVAPGTLIGSVTLFL